MMSRVELDKYVRLYKEHNEEAFDVIYHETIPAVFLSIRRICGNSNYAYDYVQDTYSTMLLKLDMYKQGTNFKGWLCTIAHNIVINSLKKKSELVIDPFENEQLFVESVDSKPSIEDAILCLSEEFIQLFELLVIKGASVKETSVVMGCDINRVYYLKTKMEKRLRKYLLNQY